MAKTATILPADRGEELVDFLIPRVGPDDRPELIGVNGQFVRVQHGETVRIRRKFAEAWDNARAQERAAWETSTRAQQRTKRALAEL